MTTPVLRIDPTGNLGNQMFQYMVALHVKARVPAIEICGYEMAAWGLTAPVPDTYPPDAVRIDGRYVSVRQIARLFERGVIEHLTLSALGLRLSNLMGSDAYLHAFTRSDVGSVEHFPSDHVVVNVRAAEVLRDTHPDYAPLPLSFIEHAIARSGARPVFLGQLGDDVYSDAIRERYPDATFRPSRGALMDFETLRHAHQIVVAASTFSWLAAWLSDAERIHVPLWGFLHPARRPDIDLLPSEDDRYTFYDCEPRQWRASSDDFAYLWAPRDHRVLDSAEVGGIRRRAASSMRMSDLRQRLRLSMRCREQNLHDRVTGHRSQ